ncbi:hypothetical protein [Shivajiella indica]|uniref:Riboflavin synthase subunit beta n=1 Tax=Shivajiella indica TaxID=872115 RepID=A0ABW5BBY1_9BACT
MAGGTSGFNMIQSTKDNRSIISKRMGMRDNPYGKNIPTIESRNSDQYDELINERFERKEQQYQSNKIVLMFFALLVLLSISLFFI